MLAYALAFNTCSEATDRILLGFGGLTLINWRIWGLRQLTSACSGDVYDCKAFLFLTLINLEALRLRMLVPTCLRGCRCPMIVEFSFH